VKERRGDGGLKDGGDRKLRGKVRGRRREEGEEGGTANKSKMVDGKIKDKRRREKRRREEE
jgi:hypothetical protein